MSIKIRIRTDKQKQSGECPIYIQYSNNGLTCVFASGASVIPSNKFITETPKDGKTWIKNTAPKHRAGNKLINDKMSEIDKLIEKLGGSPTIEELRGEYKKSQSNQNKNKSRKFSALYLEYVDIAFSNQSPTRTAKLAALKKVNAFNPNLLIDTINLNFIDKLIKFLEPDYMESTISKTIKDIKAAINFFFDRGWIEPDLYYKIQSNKFIVKSYKPSHIEDITYLQQNELKQLLEFDLSKLTEKQLLAYERHIIQTHSGLRISDINRLSPENISKDQIMMYAKKNNKPLYVPVINPVNEILSKYNNILPNITDQECNRYIKEIYKMAGLDRAVRFNKSKFNKWPESRKEDVYEWQKSQKQRAIDDSVVIVPLYSIASSHMAVRTFITLAEQFQLSLKDVCEITGKTAKTIEKHYWGKNKESRRIGMSKFETALKSR